MISDRIFTRYSDVHMMLIVFSISLRPSFVNAELIKNGGGSFQVC